MLTERLTDPRWVIWLRDPALADAVARNLIDASAIHKYADSRDLADLGGLDAVKAWPSPPSLFKLAPMSTKLQYIEGRFDGLFALACGEMDNVPASWKKWERSSGGDLHVTDEALARIPRDCVLELGEWVQESATRNGDDLPFTAPDGWAYSLSRSIARAVIRAKSDPASAPASDSSTTP